MQGYRPGTATERKARQREAVVETAAKLAGLKDRRSDLKAEALHVDSQVKALTFTSARLTTLIERVEGQIAEVEAYSAGLHAKPVEPVRRRDRLTLGLFEAGEIVGVGR